MRLTNRPRLSKNTIVARMSYLRNATARERSFAYLTPFYYVQHLGL